MSRLPNWVIRDRGRASGNADHVRDTPKMTDNHHSAAYRDRPNLTLAVICLVKRKKFPRHVVKYKTKRHDDG